MSRTAHIRGMTLIEAVVWIAVFTFAMLALTSSLLSFYRTNRYVIQEANAITSAQRGMDAAVKALRIASYSSNGGYPVVSIAANQVTFYGNVTSGDAQMQRVRLFTSGTSFQEGVIEPSGDPPSYSNTESISILADNVQNIVLATSTFIYYDQSGNQISDYSQFQNVRFVTVNLAVDVATTSSPTATILRSSAALRNLVGN